MRKTKRQSGDWNTCPSPANPVDNLDLCEMRKIPNENYCGAINRFFENGDIVEPFRTLYPNKISFSYRPFAKDNLNKSRIDFFLINPGLMKLVNDCCYEPFKIKSFDHFAVTLNFNSPGKKDETKISIEFILIS